MNTNEETLEERILKPILEYFINVPDIDNHVHNSRIKELIAIIRNMRIVIYSNDHDPPHFHVFSNDNSINAKFLIKDCDFLSGEISSKDIKRIQTFHRDIKTQLVMEMIWKKNMVLDRLKGNQRAKEKCGRKTTRYNNIFAPGGVDV